MLLGGAVNPQVQADEAEFSLISYLETHEIDSYEEFIDLIESVSPESVEKEEIDLEDISYFDIEVDYENMIVSVLTMGEGSYDRSHGASNSVSRTYYSDLGTKIFKITVSGTFSYSTGTCTALSSGGSFTKPFYSNWSSTPSFTKGNINTSKAYARISGTATSGGSTIAYSLTLTCDDSGTFGSY